MRADIYPDNRTKRQAPSAAAILAVCLFVPYCHFATPGKLRLCESIPRAYGTIYALRTIWAKCSNILRLWTIFCTLETRSWIIWFFQSAPDTPIINNLEGAQNYPNTASPQSRSLSSKRPPASILMIPPSRHATCSIIHKVTCASVRWKSCSHCRGDASMRRSLENSRIHRDMPLTVKGEPRRCYREKSTREDARSI